MGQNYQILFGDIHNHNACGYGIGSMERSIEIARAHLDFFAFTGHSSWHDMQSMEGGRENHWLKGFQKLRDQWPRVQGLIREANQNRDFSAFLGFEWHSSFFGDHCVVFPDDDQPVAYPDHVNELRRFCLEKNALMIPHHLAYPEGNRGVNWSVFEPDCTPVVEIFSEHGNSEDDRGPFPFFSHSMGGRATSNTVRAALNKGLEFGFVASSDSHSGFPGAYGEGLMAALCTDNSRQAIFEAIWARRTYALTGDRIEVDFTVDGNSMGSSIESADTVEIAFDVAGRDEMDVVELIRDGHVVSRAFPQTKSDLKQASKEPIQVRLEWGWGPWGDLALERTCDWQFDLKVKNGRLLRHFPCLQSGPFDEQRRHRFQPLVDGLSATSYTSRRGAYRQVPNQSLVLEIDGDAGTEVIWTFHKPVPQQGSAKLSELYESSLIQLTGPFPKESFLWHRLVPQPASRISGTCSLEIADGRSAVYLRARQANGHLAWASPVFVHRRER
ncbi:MAG: DUF3604 domain-containing protein [SAR324 cluster bacterium]|nr:DUF3604 domain-containing protein [SAR324 cluster bacterium]